MKVGALIRMATILKEKEIPEDRSVNLVEYRSGKYTLSFMDNKGEIKRYEVTPGGTIVLEVVE